MSVIAQLLAGLTPPAVSVPDEYEGLEWRWKLLVFRPAYFKTEVWLASALLAYLLFWLYGSSRNNKIANKWFEAHFPIYEQQFSKTETKFGKLTADGYSDFFNFSTGRRNIQSLHTVFAFKPRHDFLQWAFQTGRQLMDLHHRPKDQLELDFTLAPGAIQSDFVWALISKDELLTIKDNRWDLTLTKTTENPNISSKLSVMSEFADVTENLLKILGPLTNNEKIRPYFRSLSITDQPRERPNAPIPVAEREKHVIVSLEVPPSGHLSDTETFIAALFPFIDSLSKITLRPETKSKLKKVRDELEKELKADSEKSKKEEMEQAVQDKKAAKKKVEEERIAKMGATEQRKYLEKEKKKAMRKAHGKVVQKQ